MEIDKFMQKPYILIDDKILEKYSFENWLEKVTDY